MVQAIDIVISKEDAEQVRDDFESILLPYYIEKSARSRRGAERRIIKYHDLKKRNNKTYEKLEEYAGAFSFLSGLFQLVIGISTTLISAALFFLPYFYITLADTDRKLKNRLIELYSFDRASNNEYVANYSNWWNSSLLKTRFVSALYIMTFLLVISQNTYRLVMDVLDGIKHIENKSRKKFAKAAYYKTLDLRKDN